MADSCGGQLLGAVVLSESHWKMKARSTNHYNSTCLLSCSLGRRTGKGTFKRSEAGECGAVHTDLENCEWHSHFLLYSIQGKCIFKHTSQCLFFNIFNHNMEASTRIFTY